MEDLQFAKGTFSTVSLAHSAFNCCLHVQLYRTKVGKALYLICVLRPPLSKGDLIKTCRFLYGVQVNIHFCTFE